MLPRPGPPRDMFTITAGSWLAAMYEIPSCLRLMPGLDDDVIALAPVTLAPSTMLMAAISLSAWMNVHPGLRPRLAAMYSVSSVCGVMG